MRILMMTAAAVALTAGPLAAQDDNTARCDRSAEVAMAAVNARKEGDGKGKTRRMLRKELDDRTAADMLADWVYTLPEEQLTDEVGKMVRQQCLAL